MYHSECSHFYNGLRLECSLYLHFQCHADRKCNCNNFYYAENKNYYNKSGTIKVRFNIHNYAGYASSSGSADRQVTLIIDCLSNKIISQSYEQQHTSYANASALYIGDLTVNSVNVTNN